MTNDIYAQMRETVLTALRTVAGDIPDDVVARVEVTPARDPSHGDAATNAALVAAKAARQPPAKLAAAIVELLQQATGIARASAAGPGFVNLQLDGAVFRSLLPDILRSGIAYTVTALSATACGSTSMRLRQSHRSNAYRSLPRCVVGDALANLLAKSATTLPRNTTSTMPARRSPRSPGRRIGAICKRSTPLSEADFSAEVPGGLQYRGDYLIPIGRLLAERTAYRLAQPDGGIAAPEIWLDIARFHHRGDAAGRSRRSAPARRRTGRVQFGPHIDRKRCSGRIDRMVANARTDLRGRARSTQGQDAR
jgi:arginyl-tRNA synthetase